MKFKNDKIDFYILDKERLMHIFYKMGFKMKVNSNIFMEDKITYKILYFANETKYISFTINRNQRSDNIEDNRPKTKNSINFGKNNAINDNNPNNNYNQMNFMNNNYNQKNNANNNTIMDLNDYKKENLKLKEKINDLLLENHKLNIDL